MVVFALLPSRRRRRDRRSRTCRSRRFPDVTDTQVTVIALFPGRAAEEVERRSRCRWRWRCPACPNAVRLFSHTQFGLSFTVVTFNDKANDYFARQQVNERLRGLETAAGRAAGAGRR
jgi:cobalt-zinc-cadmium resistance protein CzcA